MAKLLGKTTRRIQQLTQDGVLETEVPPGGGARKYKTCETIQRYIARIEQKAQETAAASSTAELNLRKLEAEVELKESQGQLHKLKTAIAEGKYIKAEEATRDLADFMAMFKKFAMNIPPRTVKSIAGYADPQTARAMERAMRKELEDIKAKVAASKVTSLFDNAETVGGVKIASAYFTGTSGDTLRGMCDTIRDNAKAAAVAVLVGKSDDKITMAVTVTKDAQAKGLKAGNLVKEISAIAGGKGGGKPDFAMAGLKDETKIDEALAAVKSIVEKQLG